jgi:DNA-binding response OmpR family regulator
MRILIVEDDHKLGALLEQGLREDGFEVARASDGEEAIAKAVAADYDLILLDYMLPKRSGYEVTVELRRAGRRMPILMLTARDAPADLTEALRAGVNDLMGKPFRFGELVDRIRSLTSGSPDGQ